ncbi:tRNA (cytidine(56)-2'-O)-methyltransferase [Fervidicoccus fontis]|uniref:tRNA (cytidine(56)-2'-O)-methyltransferase n=1 Tax=Fervidicoccus fontis TaxID=683846 RepID=A0A7C2VAJ1_9CREN|nr:tRNA (cytidine(56)-2'-O)-methyltransferase [Fervidicoccus fontis]MBE9391602.1 tRNA (cytidine(56)-2'-O)-methyltransferase [Fervidicoccus fontis]PMB76297.1 MAG: tRNA (cytidine(56)-2'-O)-methyltransferase [Fervidicoccus fontis]HEW63786.1 tRNA (cytidine(56)-2'-O)-methyltransferase [Fervidicoccus fontis]
MEGIEPQAGVLRLGHRPKRDKRITTHTALVARAFGASYYFLSEVCDMSVMDNVLSVEKRWGRGFKLVSCGLSYKDYISIWRNYMKGVIVHLTMYGLELEREIDGIKKAGKPVLIIIGSEKVPGEIYKIADFNISVGNQPHSEVAALAIFLDRLYNGQELYYKFEDAKVQIEPSASGKKVISIGGNKDEKEKYNDA